MMIPYTLDTIEHDIIECMKKLVNALSEKDYDGFYALLDASVWTLEDLKEFAELNLEMDIDKFGTPLHHVEKAGAYDQCALYEFDDDTGFAVDYDLTTDGDWNDWTLQMEFLYEGDFLKVILSDIHIL